MYLRRSEPFACVREHAANWCLTSSHEFAYLLGVPPGTTAPVTWLTVSDGTVVGYQIDPELVQDFMLRAGITRAELARRVGTSKGYITDLLSGRRQPREDKVRAMAEALNVHPRALLLRAVVANSVSGNRDQFATPAPAVS